MLRRIAFWISMVGFQVVFGLAVFHATRHFYRDEPPAMEAAGSPARPALPPWQDAPGSAGSEWPANPAAVVSTVSDPAQLQRIASDSFVNQQYEQAAAAYERLLVLAPDNVDIYNNLGITLFYLGRSDSALRRLNEGIALDPSYQRIWLTLGFVNGQLGNFEDARTALTRAVGMDADNEIGQSAMQMLDALMGSE